MPTRQLQDTAATAARYWSEVHEDTDTSASVLFVRIGRLAELARARMEKIAQAHGFENEDEYRLLSVLARSADGLTHSQVADYMLIPRSTLTNRVRRLSDLGLLTQTRERSDRRQVTIRTTKKAEALVRETFLERNAHREGMLAPLTAKQRETAADLLEQILFGLHDWVV